MQLDHDQLRDLLALLVEQDIQEFKLEGDDFRLEVRRNLPGQPVTMVASPTTVPAAPSPAAVPATTAETPSAAPPTRSDLLEVKAPMVGTFYRAPAPGEPPFVEEGAAITLGQAVCILEAMKLMNEIEAEVSGTVVEILVADGMPVEFNQVLMRVKPS
ncbi:MAG: acetyl-CoA carboxylase biotin carboxyl carrier protein [Aphanocapsa feldmannii 288cV]|nr:MAG: acetyl-CoA carboxylase biotin carboxyl carrier protein [Aphanocapsa feldmannii 288cV]